MREAVTEFVILIHIGFILFGLMMIVVNIAELFAARERNRRDRWRDE